MILAAPAASWAWPADGQVIRAFSLGDDPYAGGQHRGVDIAADSGSSARAPAAGTVSFAGTVPGNGRTVTIRTGDGYAVTLVGLGSIGVAKNALVSEGEAVGTVAAAPDDGTPANVHLGIRIAADPDGYIDPLTLLPVRAEQPAANDPAGAEDVPTPVDESTPATSDGAPSSSEPAAEETAADDSDPDGAGVAGVAVGAVAEVAPAPPSSADGSTDVGDPQASTSAAQTDGAGEEMGAASPTEQLSASATLAPSQATANVASVVEPGGAANQPSPALADESSSGSGAVPTHETRAARGGSGEMSTTAATSTARLKHSGDLRAGSSEPASPSARVRATTHSRSVGLRWILLPALIVLLLGVTGGSVLVATRVHGSRRPPRM